MKKTTLFVLLSSLLTSGAALASHHSFSVGYAQSKVEDFKRIGGLNLQYRYESVLPVSLIAAFSWQEGSDNIGNGSGSFDVINKRSEIDIKYYSLLAGPAYRINSLISLYAAGGFARTKATGNTQRQMNNNSIKRRALYGRETSFAYGAGIIINPRDYLTVNLGYEGTRINMADDHRINGFNIGVGYRF